MCDGFHWREGGKGAEGRRAKLLQTGMFAEVECHTSSICLGEQLTKRGEGGTHGQGGRCANLDERLGTRQQ